MNLQNNSTLINKLNYKLILITYLIIVITMVQEGSALSRKINCRKYVHAPECRGIAAKRDTGRFNEDTRFSLDDYFSSEKTAFKNDIISTKSLLMDLLRKSLEQDLENENNYLK